jgi:hypothetical protein
VQAPVRAGAQSGRVIRVVWFEVRSLCLRETVATVAAAAENMAKVATKHQRRDGAEVDECAGERKGCLARVRAVYG